MYLSYSDYTNMGGTLDEATFNDFEFESECIVDWYTFNRLHGETEYPERLTKCMYALIKLAKLKADAMSLGSQTITTSDGEHTKTITTSASIASQSNDGVSISYNTLNVSDIFEKLSPYKRGGEVWMTVKMYLQGVTNSLGRKLLYRGIYEDE